MIDTLRDFLNKHKVLDEYCTSLEQLKGQQPYQVMAVDALTGLFSWYLSNERLYNTVNWDTLHSKWGTSLKGNPDARKRMSYATRAELAQALRRQNRKKLVLLTKLRDYRC